MVESLTQFFEENGLSRSASHAVLDEQLYRKSLKYCLTSFGGTAVAQWLRCCATNRKVAGSIPAGISGFFIDIKSF